MDTENAIDIENYDEEKVIARLMSELAKGDESIAEGEFYSPEEVEKMLFKN